VVAKVAGSNPTIATQGEVAEFPGSIVDIAMTDRSDGAWVAWSRLGCEGVEGADERIELPILPRAR
jgi:hypothetical protein